MLAHLLELVCIDRLNLQHHLAFVELRYIDDTIGCVRYAILSIEPCPVQVLRLSVTSSEEKALPLLVDSVSLCEYPSQASTVLLTLQLLVHQAEHLLPQTPLVIRHDDVGSMQANAFGRFLTSGHYLLEELNLFVNVLGEEKHSVENCLKLSCI